MFFRKRPKEVKTARLYEYISLRRNKWSVAALSKILGVSETGYYRSLHKAPASERREHLLVKIREIISQFPDNDNYGAKRIHIALLQQKERASYSTVYRIMKENSLLQNKKRHPNGITHEDIEAQKSENLIQRDFTADIPNEKWLTDITEVPCMDGKLYVVPVLDCFDGKIVGLEMDDNMRAEVCVRAFENACRHGGAG